MGEIEIEDRKYKHAEFDELMQNVKGKIEYHAGYIRKVEMKSPNHNRLQAETLFSLARSLEKKQCFGFGSSQGIAIEKEDRYFFPDASFVCGAEEYLRDLYLKNPSVIVEVASENTLAYNEGEKMFFYFKIASLKEYIVVCEDKPLAIVHTQNDKKQWTTAVFMGLKSKIHLPNFNLDLEMKDIYRRVKDLEELK